MYVLIMGYLAPKINRLIMKVAVIDMGSNTFHLLIVEVKKSDFHILYREKSAVKIGENGINEGRITEEASVRALVTLKAFRKIIDKHHVDEVFATATSAIRSAKNGKDLVRKIKQATGIDTRIISGLQEAEYIYYGVKKAMDIGDAPALIMDIGGGSIEFILGTNKEILWKQSFEIGGLRMVEKFHKHDPMLGSEIEEVESYLEENLEELFKITEKYKPQVLIGSSGTFDTLSDIYRIENEIERAPEQTELPLTLESYLPIHANIVKKTKKDRLAIPGMIPLRVDMIVVASVLINYIIRRAQIKDIRVSAYALKEGVLLNTLHSLKKASFQ